MQHLLVDFSCEIHSFLLCSCNPWLKLHVVGLCPFQGVDIPHDMHVGLRLYYLSLADMSRLICEIYEQFWQATSDIGRQIYVGNK